jgi:hypothetical protein
VWWNQSYQEIRRYAVRSGQRISQEYIDPDVAIAHLSTAWATGKSLQILEITPRLLGRFQYEGNEDGTWVQWQRIGNLVIEVSSEVGEVLALRKMIGDQKSLLIANAQWRSSVNESLEISTTPSYRISMQPRCRCRLQADGHNEKWGALSTLPLIRWLTSFPKFDEKFLMLRCAVLRHFGFF